MNQCETWGHVWDDYSSQDMKLRKCHNCSKQQVHYQGVWVEIVQDVPKPVKKRKPAQAGPELFESA